MKSRKNFGVFLMLIGLLLIAICTASCDASVSKSPDIDAQLRAIIAERGLTGDPSVGRDLPNIEDPLPQLGMLLFYSQALSGNGDSACVSCHHPALGGGDGLPMSIGVDAHNPALLGPGRTHPEGPLVPRNAPTTYNAGMWDQFMFHDGRVESMGKTPGANGNDGYGIRTPDRPWGYPDVLAGENLVVAQARFPVTAADEMRGFDFGKERGNNPPVLTERARDLLAQIVGDYGEGEGVLATNNWLVEFQEAYQSTESAEELITFENIVHAIGEYERSQVFVNTPWKAYLEGDQEALSESAKRGAVLFFTSVAQGGADCASCHSGDYFTDEQFYVLAIPQIGTGKDSGIYGDDDWGRYLETQRDEDKYAFRTPPLLNVEVTGPYGHDGAYATLEGVVLHHLNPAEAIANYDYTQLDPAIRVVNAELYTAQALEQLQKNRANGVMTVMDIDLTDEQVNDLLNFLFALTDPCVKDRACLAPWIPDADTPDPDGMRLNAVDKVGNSL